MNILLFLPGFIFLSVLSTGLLKTTRHVLIILASQVAFLSRREEDIRLTHFAAPPQFAFHATRPLRLPPQRLSILPCLSLPMDGQLALHSGTHLPIQSAVPLIGPCAFGHPLPFCDQVG
jgi:hypothetical protein